MSEHTPEPWSQECEGNGSMIFGPGGFEDLIADLTGEKWQENGRRIVACVNACRGIETDLIEHMTAAVIAGNPVHETLYGAQQLTRERDEARAMVKELLEALKECAEWMEFLRACGDAGNWNWNDDEYTRAMSIIAKAEGRS